MHALIVVAHHHPRSLTCPRRPHRRRRSPRRPFRGNRRSGFGRLRAALQPGRPRRASRPGVASADVLAEQARIDRADTLVLVYPIYWWSMPALLKGWIDRVFSNGWAFDYSIGGDLRKSCSACAWCWLVSAAPMPAPSSGTATPGRCAPRSTMASSITAAHGWSVPNCCWSRRAPIQPRTWSRLGESAPSCSPAPGGRRRPEPAAGDSGT